MSLANLGSHLNIGKQRNPEVIYRVLKRLLRKGREGKLENSELQHWSFTVPTPDKSATVVNGVRIVPGYKTVVLGFHRKRGKFSRRIGRKAGNIYVFKYIKP